MNDQTPASPDPDKPSPHDDFHANVAITPIVRDGDSLDSLPHTYMAHVTAACAACGEKMRWTGLKAGTSFHHPMVSVDETELRAPMRPASSDPDFGMGIPGFAINYRPASSMTPPNVTEIRAGLSEIANDIAADMIAGIPFEVAVDTLSTTMPALFSAAETQLMLAVAIAERSEAINAGKGEP